MVKSFIISVILPVVHKRGVFPHAGGAVCYGVVTIIPPARPPAVLHNPGAFTACVCEIIIPAHDKDGMVHAFTVIGVM